MCETVKVNVNAGVLSIKIGVYSGTRGESCESMC